MNTRIKVLIVDDYLENIAALSQLIAGEDIEILTATNATDALELVNKNEFGLLLLDVQMPGINGFELAKIIRSVERFKSLPIIFVTAQQPDLSFIFEGYQTGAVDLLFKPLDPHMVRAKVRLFVQMAQQKAILKAQVVELKQLKTEADTANKKLEETLHEVHLAKAEADTANMAKSAFLANMSHEIRTPLGAIMGFSELCQQSNLGTNELQAYTQIIHRNSKQVLKLIDEILDLAKVEAGKVYIEEIEFSLPSLLKDLAETLSVRANQKGIDFSVRITTDLPMTIVSDPTRIRQVLLNSVGNAIKFTEHGQISVEISLIDNLLTAKITDTGTGISDEQASQLFKPFHQADISTTRKFGGTGLGLVLNKQLCQLLGGDYVLERSSLGEGSVFTATFSIQSPSEGQSFIKADEYFVSNSENITSNVGGQLAGLNILVVDDAPDNQKLLSIILDREGASYTGARDGNEAVEQALNNDYDVVLMDIQMPNLDGYGALSKLQAKGYRKPVIALTAHAMREEIAKVQAAGFFGFLAKPINYVQLIDMLATAGHNSLKQTEQVENSQTAIVIEDDNDIRDLMATVLGSMGLEVHQAVSGLEALKLIDAGLKPKIIFCDLSLPDIPGDELIKKFKSDFRLKKSKIAIVSGKADLQTVALESGADVALKKPVNLAEIENVVEQQCSF